MIPPDTEYMQRLVRAQVLRAPVLELGTGYGGSTCRELITSAGLTYYGTDIADGEGVDFVANFENRADLAAFRSVAPFGSILVLNVLEHTFDPIRILDNARTLIKAGGTLVVMTPVVWPLHDYPFDAWRILPNFFEDYARRNGLELGDDYFDYIGYGAVRNFRNQDLTYRLPPPCQNKARYWFGRAVHKAFNTFARGMLQPSHVAVGAVLTIPQAA